MRAAFRWAVDHDLADAAIRIAACVHQAARMRLRTETFGWAAEVADLARRIEHRKLPLLLTMAADSAWGLGLLDDAKRYGHEAIALADDPRYEPFVWAYADLAQIALFEGDVATSLELLRAGAAHPADRRDRLNLAYLILVGGAVGQPLPDDELAEAMSQINAAGFPLAIALALNGRRGRHRSPRSRGGHRALPTGDRFARVVRRSARPNSTAAPSSSICSRTPTTPTVRSRASWKP